MNDVRRSSMIASLRYINRKDWQKITPR